MYPNFTYQVAYHPVGHLMSTPGSLSDIIFLSEKEIEVNVTFTSYHNAHNVKHTHIVT